MTLVDTGVDSLAFVIIIKNYLLNGNVNGAH